MATVILPRKGDTAIYKDKPYRVEFCGPTKFGTRAKLKFLNGAGDGFWVPADKLSPPPPIRYEAPRGWRSCGYPGCSPTYCDECDGEGYKPGR